MRNCIGVLVILAAGCGNIAIGTECIPDGGGDMAGCIPPTIYPDLGHRTPANGCEAQFLCEHADVRPAMCPVALESGNYDKLTACARRECGTTCTPVVGMIDDTLECKKCLRSHAADGAEGIKGICAFCP